MNAHRLRSILSRRNAAPLTILVLFSVVVICGFSVGTAGSSAKVVVAASNSQIPPGLRGPTGEDLKKEFNDDDLKVNEEKPRGKWAYSPVLDMSQLKDPSLPAYVNGIQMLTADRGKYRGVAKIKRVELINRSSRVVNAVQLRWTVAKFDEPGSILSEGTIPFVNIWVVANSTQVIEIPALYPVRLLKPLAKDGELSGHFRITISMQEIHFADGSFWRRREPVAHLKLLINNC